MIRIGLVMPLYHLKGFFCSNVLGFFVLFILIVIHWVFVSFLSEVSAVCTQGFLHLELLAGMSALQANEKEADTVELSPCLAQGMLAFLWQFGLWTNFLESGGSPGFLKLPPQPHTQGDVGSSGEIPQNHLPFDLPLTFAWLPAAPWGRGRAMLFLNEK